LLFVRSDGPLLRHWLPLLARHHPFASVGSGCLPDHGGRS
jgi:hypothetical protein